MTVRYEGVCSKCEASITMTMRISKAKADSVAPRFSIWCLNHDEKVAVPMVRALPKAES